MMLFCKYKILGRNNCFIIVFLFFYVSVNSQCPDKTFLEKRIVSSYTDTAKSTTKQLAEFFSYLGKTQNCPNQNDSTHSRLIYRIAVLHAQLGDYLNAIKYCRESINIITSNPDKKVVSFKDLPGHYYWLSEYYAKLNLSNERIAALDSCYTVAIRIRYIDASATQALYKLGEYYFDIGDYNQAIDYMHQCESLSKELSPEYKIYFSSFLSSSILWQVKGLLELKKYEEAERLLTSRIDECKRSGQINNLGTIYSQFAELQMRKNNFQKAIEFYHKSFASDKKAGNNFNCRQILKEMGYGVYFQHFHDGNKAMAYYLEALNIANKDQSLRSKDAMESLDIFRLMGKVFVQKRQFDSAHYYFQLAYRQIDTKINAWNVLHYPQAEILQTKKIYYLTSLIIDEADAYRNQYEFTNQSSALEKSIRIYKIADQFLDKIKLEQDDLQSKLFWRSDSKRLYENAITACYLNNNPNDAFYFFERSRSVLLSDQLNEQRWLGEGDISKQSQLQKEILAKERELTDLDNNSSQYNELKNELFTRKEELYKLKEHIKQNNPLYYQNFLDSAVLNTSTLNQSILKNHDALIELFSGDSAVYVLAVTRQKSYLQKINKDDFDRLAEAYRNFISNPDLLNRKFDEFTSVSSQLYQLVFQKINLPAGRIIISPDGKSFPFEALITNKQYHTYFIDDHAVSYTYSAHYLLNQFATNSANSSYTFMGMAPVQYSKLPPLLGSDQSLHSIKNYFANITTLTGNNASRNNFLHDYFKYKIIQLYTHATDSGSTGEPVIYFSDSSLSLSDLFYENKPSTSLIVLSACETANGKLYNGEGVFSFSRQFAALGIPSSISNLWNADNESSYKITELFYKYVSKGLPLDVALQKAKKEFKEISSKESSLPYYWAAPILIGQTNKIPLQKEFPWKWAGAGAFLIVLITTGVWLWKRRITPYQTIPPKKEIAIQK